MYFNGIPRSSSQIRVQGTLESLKTKRVLRSKLIPWYNEALLCLFTLILYTGVLQRPHSRTATD